MQSPHPIKNWSPESRLIVALLGWVMIFIVVIATVVVIVNNTNPAQKCEKRPNKVWVEVISDDFRKEFKGCMNSSDALKFKNHDTSN